MSKRYIWLVTSPDGNQRVYARQVSLEEDLPGRTKFTKRALNESGTIWEYGSTKKFLAKRLAIRDSDNLPV
jgi:hypothetical protein